jgi:RNA polymerase sigma-70 factor (ECF subfamily)
VAFTPLDRDLLQRLLKKQPAAWNDFVDRYLGLVYHVVHSTAHLRSARLAPEDVEDIVAEVLLQVVAEDYKALRQFQQKASLSSYLTVIARRTAVHELARRQSVREAIRRGEVRATAADDGTDETPAFQKGLETLEEVERLLRKLHGQDREMVRMYYLEGRTYEEISTELDVPVNTVGAKLSRARAKLREMHQSATDVPTLRRLADSDVRAAKKVRKR